MNDISRRVAITVMVMASALACTRRAASTDSVASSDSAVPPLPPAGVRSPEQPNDTTVQRLEREARALAHTTGCASAAECRTAPVGSRACGGPRDYIVYCRASTDSAALFAKLAELARAEEAFNAAHRIVSTCEFRMPPGVEYSGGACKARAAGSLNIQ